MLAALALGALGLGAPRANAQDVPVPTSFARPAAAARAASIVIRIRNDDADGSLTLSDLLLTLRDRTLAAGVIVDPSGIALTSARAVLSDDFEVLAGDGAPLNATLLALDRRTDLAVLRLQDAGRIFPYLPLGDSDRVAVGDWVITIGAPHGLEATVSAGIVTAKPVSAGSSPLRGFLQTDAATGPGSAGGAVVTLDGEIVGLNTVLSGANIGYALPSKVVRKVYLELLEKGRVSRPWLGVTTQSLTEDLARALRAPDAAGVLVSDVARNGPAAAVGLRPGDIVTALDATRVSSRAQLDRAVGALAPGRAVTLTLLRDGRRRLVSLTMGEEPDDWRPTPERARAERLLGIDVRPITPSMGAVMVSVAPGSSAELVGLEPGDIIRELNRRPVGSILDFDAVTRTLRPGSTALMLVQRGDVAVYVVLTVQE